MSIATEISRIQTDRNTIRAKLVELGMATNTDNLDTLAAAIDDITNQGAVSATVQEGDTYTIPKGYHNGSGTVSGVAGGGNYSLQSKTVTPTKKQQNVTPDSGYYGISDVTVAPIPDAYQDVTSVTAGAADVLSGKVYVLADGTVTTGTMPNNGAVTKALGTGTTSYTIPKGYHNGSGKVSITLETKSVTPTKSAQDITPASGKVLSKVSVAAIPAAYQDVTSVDAEAGHVLDGKKIVAADGTVVTGTMADNGAVSATLHGLYPSYTVPAGYHDGTGVVKISQSVGTATPTKEKQTVSPMSGTVFTRFEVNPIPDAYQDVTGVTATAGTVLEGSSFVSSTGAAVAGTMANNGDTSGEIDGLTVTSFAIPAGYTTGGTVSLTADIEEALAAI